MNIPADYLGNGERVYRLVIDLHQTDIHLFPHVVTAEPNIVNTTDNANNVLFIAALTFNRLQRSLIFRYINTAKSEILRYYHSVGFVIRF